MTFEQFIGQVQHRAKLASIEQAVRAIRCTFQILSRRLTAEQANGLASQLPREIAIHLSGNDNIERMSVSEFFGRVSECEQVPLPKSIYHARVVIGMLTEAVSHGAIAHLKAQLPQEWSVLFETRRGRETIQPVSQADGQQHRRRVRDIATPNPVVIHPDAMICEAAATMEQNDVGILPVCDGDALIGTITDRDLAVRAVAKGYDPLSTRVRDIMSTQVHHCYEDDDVHEAARTMEQWQVRRLPVLNRNDHIVGMISIGDLALRTHDERLVEEVMERVCEPV